MGFIDRKFAFSKQQSLTGTSDVVSSDVHDAEAAKKVFGGAGQPVKVAIQVTAAGGTSPTFRARLVGADNAGLTANAEIIADTGVSKVLAAADLPVLYELVPAHQKVAKRYYGVIYTLGGTSPTATANANLVLDAQSGGFLPA